MEKTKNLFFIKVDAKKLILASLFALATSYAAQLKIFLPWTPVPITFQTFVVLASGISLGCWYGGLSQILYVCCGAAGLPLFAGMEGGFVKIILGPRGGYLLGFILASFFVGRLVKKTDSFLKIFTKLCIANFGIIYGFGCTQLAFWLYAVKGVFPSLMTVLYMGALPFIFGGLVKIFMIYFLTRINS
jgi:biotin transport system substrate-specific component